MRRAENCQRKLAILNQQKLQSKREENNISKKHKNLLKRYEIDNKE